MEFFFLEAGFCEGALNEVVIELRGSLTDGVIFLKIFFFGVTLSCECLSLREYEIPDGVAVFCHKKWMPQQHHELLLGMSFLFF